MKTVMANMPFLRSKINNLKDINGGKVEIFTLKSCITVVVYTYKCLLTLVFGRRKQGSYQRSFPEFCAESKNILRLHSNYL